MDNVGFIREKLDIKLLVLFVLSRLTRPVTILALSDLVLTESSVNYFDFIDALSSLVKSEHVMELDEDRYIITSKGIRNLAEFETRIPYTVRLRAGSAAERMARVLQRNAMVQVNHEMRSDGSATVHLALSDGLGPILSIDLLAGNEQQAETMEKNFHKNAEEYYGRIANMLLD